MPDPATSNKGVCRNCGMPIRTEETCAHGPHGIAHHYYKHCLRALKEALEESVRALGDAAMSLRTISRMAGKDEYLADFSQIRGYAESRADAALSHLSEKTDVA